MPAQSFKPSNQKTMQSRINELYRELIEQGDFTPSASGLPEKALEQEIRDEILIYFEEQFEEPIPEERFAIPPDFMYFLLLLQDGFIHFGDEYGLSILGWKRVVADTKYWADIDCDISSQKEIWLSVGEYSDRHWLFICCDPESRNFGKVVDAYDNTPWNDYEILDYVGEFPAFLEWASRFKN